MTINIHDWDRSPADRLLTWPLAGAMIATGDGLESELEVACAAGLLEYRIPTESDLRQSKETRVDLMWVVSLTGRGCEAGLLLASSPALLELLAQAAEATNAGRDWPGVHVRYIVNELDLRAGGTGTPIRLHRWLKNHDYASLAELPRRGGLDPVAQVRASA